MQPDPPRFVPTLTEVVTASGAAPAPLPALPPLSAEDLRMQDELAEEIAHRVLQRVDAVLEERLNATIRAVVARHTEQLLPALREEIVTAVQTTVAAALADEFMPLPAPSADS